VPDFLRIQGEPLTKAGLGNRFRSRLTLRQGEHNVTVYLKRFGREPFWRQIGSWWRHRTRELSALREARTTSLLAADGFPVPELLAKGLRDTPASEAGNFLVLAAVPGEPAHHWVSKLAPSSGSWRPKLDFVARLAALASRFHQHGWRHRDFYLGHIFVSGAGPNLQLSLIDLQRVFRPSWRKERWQIKDLAQLNFSALSRFSKSLRLRFALQYFQSKRLTKEHKALIRKIARKTQAMTRRGSRGGDGSSPR